MNENALRVIGYLIKSHVAWKFSMESTEEHIWRTNLDILRIINNNKK